MVKEMTDKADAIHDELETILTGMGLTVQRDRDLPPNAEDGSFPYAVLWTGDEVLAPDGTTTKQTWDRRWQTSPAVEIFLQNRADPSVLRPQSSTLWRQFWQGLRGSEIPKLFAPAVYPDIRKSIDPMPQRPDILVLSIEMSFTFDR